MMFDGTGIDTEIGMLMAVGGFAFIAIFMAQAGIRSLVEQMKKRSRK